MPEIHEKPGISWLGVGHEPPVVAPETGALPRYAELHCISNFSFQRGASHPQELVWRAWDLGYEALALTDECSLAGVVRAWSGLREYRAYAERLEREDGVPRVRPAFRFIPGSEFDFGDGRLVALVRDLAGWRGLCRFISTARRAVPKGRYEVDWARSDLGLLVDCQILFAPRREALSPSATGDFDIAPLIARLRALRERFEDRLWLAVELPGLRDDGLWLAALREAGARADVPLVASGDAHMHARSRQPLLDVLHAVRLGRPVSECGLRLQPNAERHLRRRMDLERIFPRALIDETLRVIEPCRFDFEGLRDHYQFPRENVPAGQSAMATLRRLAWQGAQQRFGRAIPRWIRRQMGQELTLIGRCNYAMFFLTVHDIVGFARREGILCQGRGSAANSIVCYCLGITAADPRQSHPLLERFISEARRNEPPDIDVDFEHARREEVIQYIYRKYGRDRAALAAVVIGYRTRSALRDVGRALGVAEPLVDAFAKDHFWFDPDIAADKLDALAARVGVPLAPRMATLWITLARQLLGFPRHLSQHVGGFVLTEGPLIDLVPVENAAMPERSVIQWDKDDLEDMGLLKVDVLALGMLTALRRCLDLREQVVGRPLALDDIPADDAATYAMIRRADTVGVFQIESRAQMSMLPRLKPARFYDLVVEVAIVRPGPIEGGMVHPYLRARERVARGLPIDYEKTRDERAQGRPSRLEQALGRTLGVPIFQEQVMEIAMLAAGFSGAEADSLRRAMAAWKRKGGVERFRDRLMRGMRENGYAEDYAERIFSQMLGFGEYGFPESHAFSFALLAYASSWLKCHAPDAYLAALLDAQPMGFYSPSQLIQDGRRHGLDVRPPDVCHSDWLCTLEPPARAATRAPDGRRLHAVRVGLRLVNGLGEAAARRIMQARAEAPWVSTEDLALRASLDPRELRCLAAADALRSLSGHRRQQAWDAAAHRRPTALLADAPVGEAALDLPAAPEGEDIVFDYAALGFTLRRHPLALLRPRLARMGLRHSAQLRRLAHGQPAAACGIVTVRQQPQTAKGTLFVTIEDEHGPINVIVWKSVREGQREALLHARLLAVHGTWQRDAGGRVCHLVAERLVDLSPLLGRIRELGPASRDFH
jgi:error-prone DNA polymerase